jgi:phosphatidylglycerol:prolipoprotein diacylglycerol transferase
MLQINKGGLAIYGGIIFGLITILVYCRIKKLNCLKTLDAAAPAVMIAQAIGRWGNFFNEEAHGGETDLPWAQIIDGKGYHPTFLYESIWCFLLFLFLIWFSNHRRSFRGQIICLYFMLYSFERFFVESLRTDSLMIGSLRQAQVISVVLFSAGLILYFVFKKTRPVITQENDTPSGSDDTDETKPE